MSAYVEHFIELMFGLSMFTNAMLFIPQAIKIYKTKSTHGLSKITFLGFNAIQVFTMLHGYINNDYALVFGFIFSLITSGVVTFLIFYYD